MMSKTITSLLTAVLIAGLGQPVRAEAPDLNAVSGLAIDLGSQSFEPAMSIRILADNGQVLYGEMEDLSPEKAADVVERGMAAFATTWQEVKERCGDQPLVVRSLRVQGQDIVISGSAADQIRKANEQKHFLENMQVAVITTQSGGPSQPEVIAIGPQDLPPGQAGAPHGLKLHPMPAWQKFRMLSPQQRKALMERFMKNHPRQAARIAAMQMLSPQERRIVREFFGKARLLPPEERKGLQRQFRQQHPELARKLQVFFQLGMGGPHRRGPR